MLEDRLAHMETLLHAGRTSGAQANSWPTMSLQIEGAAFHSQESPSNLAGQSAGGNLEQHPSPVSRRAEMTLGHSRPFNTAKARGGSTTCHGTWNSPVPLSNGLRSDPIQEKASANEQDRSVHENEEISISPQQVRLSL